MEAAAATDKTQGERAEKNMMKEKEKGDEVIAKSSIDPDKSVSPEILVSEALDKLLVGCNKRVRPPEVIKANTGAVIDDYDLLNAQIEMVSAREFGEASKWGLYLDSVRTNRNRICEALQGPVSTICS